MMGSMMRRGAITETTSGTSAPVLTASSVKSNSFTLSWTATGTTYEVQQSSDGGITWSAVSAYTTNTATSVAVQSLLENYGYDYRVRASNDGGSTWSSYGQASVTTLGAVSSLTLPSTTSSSISVSWTDNSTQETGFRVERSTDNSTWTLVTTTAANATSATVSGLSASTLYYIRVRAEAYDGTNNSAWYSSTATTAAPVASWTLDFSSGTPTGYTLTRASSGTFIDSSGYIASASTDGARLTHNSSGSRLGLLVEEARTNLAIRSEDFSTNWIGLARTVTTNAIAAPDNQTTADRIVETTATSRHGFYVSTPTLTANTVYTWSLFFKKDTRQYVTMQLNIGGGRQSAIFDLTNGTVSDTKSSSVNNADTRIENVGNGWYRCSVTCSVNSTSGNLLAGTSSASTFSAQTLTADTPDFAGSTSEGMYVWGAQLEAGSAPTSYISTTTASVTRSADLAHVLDSSITSWGDPGALVVHFYPPQQAGTILSTDDASTAQVGIEASTTTAARAFWSSGSTSTGTIGSGVQKAVHYWTGSSSKFCINSGTVQSGTNNLTIANTDFVTFGAEATDSSGSPGTFSQYANCVIRKIEFYSGTRTDAELQTITT